MTASHIATIPANNVPGAREYAALKVGFARLRASSDPVDRKLWAEERDRVIAQGSESLEVRSLMSKLAERGMLSERVSPSSVHGPTFLSNMSVKYANEQFIGEALLPVLPVTKLSDEYAIYRKRDMLAVPSAAMPPNGEANEVFQNRDVDSYTCKPWGFKEGLERKTVENQDEVFDEMMDLNEHVAHLLAFDREQRAMAVLTTSGNFGGNTAALVAGEEWDSSAGGDPVKTIRTARHNLWSGTGPGMTIGYCPVNVFLALSCHPAILDLTKHTKAGFVPKAELAAFFELDDILVAKAWQDTANSGQTASVSRMVSTDVFGMVRVTAPSRRNAGFGFNFRFKGQVNNLTWFEPQKGTLGKHWNQQTSDEIHKVVAPDTGYLITNCLK